MVLQYIYFSSFIKLVIVELFGLFFQLHMDYLSQEWYTVFVVGLGCCCDLNKVYMQKVTNKLSSLWN